MTTLGPVSGSDVTAREAEVLALLAQHLTNVQIADALYISVRTVESHVSALLRKLQLPDRRSLARHFGTDPITAARGGRRALPNPITPFIGRTTERAALTAALAEHRMVTAVGPGGVGKTRLALSVAAEIAQGRSDGAWFVDLAQVTDAGMVPAAVAEVLGVSEQRSVSIDVALLASLADRDVLLVIDNCEHLLDGVRDCIELILQACPNVTVLATSRARLLVPYEWVYVVPALSVTDDGGDAVDLFAARVAATDDSTPPDTRRVADLCRALDGMALAIELAAARYSTLGLDGLEAGLEDRLRFLTAGGRLADRHRSLRDAIGWSYYLLTTDDRSLLRAVTVFASWFDVDAAQALAEPGIDRATVVDGLARLANDSLLLVERGEPTRYRALETIRQYGVEQLRAAGELDDVRASHERWCRELVSTLGNGEPDDAWCARFDGVVDDFRTALQWAASDERRRTQSSEDAAEFAAELAGLLFIRGRPAEAQRRYEQAADLTASQAGSTDYLRLAAGAASSRFVGNETLRLLGAAVDLAISLDDRSGAARDLAWMSIYKDRSPGIMADKPIPGEAAALRDAARAISDGSARAEAAIATAKASGGYKRDPAVLEWSRQAVDLANDAGDITMESAALDQLCCVFQELDNIPEAARAVGLRLELLSTMTMDASSGFEITDTFLMASDVRLAAGDLVGAGRYADTLARLPFYRDEEHLAIARRLKVDALTGNFEDVVRNGELFRVGWDRAGRPAASDLAAATYAVAMVHGMLGDSQRRSAWLGITVALGVAPERLASCRTGWAPTFDALLALHHDDPNAALNRLSADLEDPQVWSWGSMFWRPWYAAVGAEAAVLGGHHDADAFIKRGRHAARDNPIATAIVERAAAIAARDHPALEGCASKFEALGCPYQQARTRTIVASLR